MSGKRFPDDYVQDEKQALVAGDKLFIYDSEGNKNGIIDAANLSVSAGSGATKDGYDWKKNSDNATNEYQQGETIEGVGTLYPGFYIKAYFTSTPGVDDPKNHIIILFSKEI